MLIIRRSRPEKNFLIIPNVALFDERLGYIARGVLHELLGRPPGWQTNAEKLAEAAQRHRGSKGESKRALRLAFAELEAAGYMTRQRSRVPKGEPNGGDFVTILTVYDVPQNGHHEDASYGGFMDEGPMREGFTIGGSLETTDVETTDHKDQQAQHSSALAAARAGEDAREQDRMRLELDRLYSAANKLDDDKLRRLLLQFERKRPQVYRDKRQRALAQLGREDPDALHSVRAVDLLSFKYGLLHYWSDDKPLPAWLTRFPR
ncbi:hypothetical protein M2155_000635 [Streptomyces sp. SAI-119]|uniref:hypothetical protein n=1 Tax=Streptomyces sp. SAI-119 TaxID=2940541 RepID=UPI0024753BFF|nr:hypothetical protein [Streptomyces sp. SAI-119]MDH6448227.1 hypothetical protein [Streptomyces sp. SAI-119]